MVDHDRERALRIVWRGDPALYVQFYCVDGAWEVLIPNATSIAVPDASLDALTQWSEVFGGPLPEGWCLVPEDVEAA